jgi:ornithine carbamoyltransferase
MPVRHFLSVSDLTRDETIDVLERAAQLKVKWNTQRRPSKKLRGYTLAGIYEKPSLRTRVTFEAGMTQLGGHTIYLGPADIKLGERETISDTARNLSRWVQIITARTFSHATITQLAAHSSVPVINTLSDREHPCQALADFLTLQEHVGRLQGAKIAYVGDGNNVAHSLMLMGGLLGTNVAIATPSGYSPDPRIVDQARQYAAESDAEIVVTTDVEQAVTEADAIYGDVWASMGQESEREERATIFMPYQITNDVLRATGNPATIFLHCLPAHRGEEVTAEVFDGPQSKVFDQAENRLHAQKALILFLLDM